MLVLHKANKERFDNVRRDCLRAIQKSGSVSLWIVYDFDRPAISNLGTYEDVERLTFEDVSNLFCSPLSEDSFYWFWVEANASDDSGIAARDFLRRGSYRFYDEFIAEV